MKTLQQALQYVGLILILPVITAGLLGILLSPLQSSARLPKPIRMLEAIDLPLASQEPLREDQSNQTNPVEAEPRTQEKMFEDDGEACTSDLQHVKSAEREDNTEAGIDEVNYQFAQEVYDSGTSESWYSSEQLYENGVIYDGSRYYTWYSEKELLGIGLNIPGRHVSDEGYILDEHDRIVVASCMYAYQEEIDIPFGNGRAIVLDYCPGKNIIDIYTSF